MITASHNPGKDNGIKLYRDQVIAVALDSGLDEIRDAVLSDTFKPASKGAGGCEPRDITEDWVEHCLTFVEKLRPFHIAIDAGNGMAGAILPHILPRLPITVEPLYFELDGTFPNHPANPQDPTTLKDLSKKIIDEGLDFGIAFDGDGDRAGFVDDAGRPVLGTDLISIVAQYYLARNPGAKIVHEVRTSRATQELIHEWGGTPVRTKAGRIEIGRVVRELGSPFGAETTGHFFYGQNYDVDAALITALVAMQALSDALGDSGKKLSELVDEYRRYAIISETNFEVADKPAAFARLRADFADGRQDELDGLTVNYADKWFNVRASNTEPVMRLNAEAADKPTLDTLVKHVRDILMEGK
jgi:phosphomannomutase